MHIAHRPAPHHPGVPATAVTLTRPRHHPGARITDLAAPDTRPGRTPAAVHVRTFPAQPREARRARAWLTGVLGDTPAADGAVAEDAVACLSELAANAITHSNSRRPGGTFTVTTAIAAGLLRVEVTDHGGPWRNRRAQSGETGRGLQIVSHLAARSGITGTGRRSRTVWFEIDYPGNHIPERAITSPDPATADARAAARDLLRPLSHPIRDPRERSASAPPPHVSGPAPGEASKETRAHVSRSPALPGKRRDQAADPRRHPRHAGYVDVAIPALELRSLLRP